MNLPRKTLLLIGILATLAVVLVASAIWLSANKPEVFPPLSQTTPTPNVPKTALLEFSPSSINMVNLPNSPVTINIMAGSDTQKITGVQTEIVYDPAVVTNVKLLPPTADTALFKAGSLQLFNSNDPVKGVLSYAVAINLDGTGVTGTGSIGQLSFTVIKGTVPTTAITFGGNTIVTSEGVQGSILKTSTPLTIQIAAPTATSSSPAL